MTNTFMHWLCHDSWWCKSCTNPCSQFSDQTYHICGLPEMKGWYLYPFICFCSFLNVQFTIKIHLWTLKLSFFCCVWKILDLSKLGPRFCVLMWLCKIMGTDKNVWGNCASGLFGVSYRWEMFIWDFYTDIFILGFQKPFTVYQLQFTNK